MGRGRWRERLGVWCVGAGRGLRGCGVVLCAGDGGVKGFRRVWLCEDCQGGDYGDGLDIEEEEEGG